MERVPPYLSIFERSRAGIILEINMSLMSEFKEFSVKGNVVDLAVGVIIGVAFGKIVSSLVSDVIMPPLGFLIGGVDFKNLEVILREAVGTAPAVTIKYGNFLQTVFDFLIVAVCVFVLVKAIMRLKKSNATQEVIAPALTSQEKLLMEIRDLLAKRSTSDTK
jgi:large conductance mechanosensitive channel